MFYESLLLIKKRKKIWLLIALNKKQLMISMNNLHLGIVCTEAKCEGIWQHCIKCHFKGGGRSRSYSLMLSPFMRRSSSLSTSRLSRLVTKWSMLLTTAMGPLTTCSKGANIRGRNEQRIPYRYLHQSRPWWDQHGEGQSNTDSGCENANGPFACWSLGQLPSETLKRATWY